MYSLLGSCFFLTRRCLDSFDQTSDHAKTAESCGRPQEIGRCVGGAVVVVVAGGAVVVVVAGKPQIITNHWQKGDQEPI